MLVLLCQLFGFAYIFLFFIASCGGRHYKPNGYGPRGGRGPQSNNIIVGELIQYKPGQEVMVSSLDEFLKGNGTIKYYNKETDELQDVKPERN